MSRVKGELKLISKHASMVTTQVEQVLKAQNDLLNVQNSKNNDYAVRVATRTGKLTLEPMYPEGLLRELSKILRVIIIESALYRLEGGEQAIFMNSSLRNLPVRKFRSEELLAAE